MTRPPTRSLRRQLYFKGLIRQQTSLSWAIYILCFHPLAHVPGPRLWILSPLPYISVLRRGRFAIRIKELHEIYGPVLRLGVNEVSFIDEQAWTDIYSYHQSSSFPKSPYWYRIRPNGAYGIMASPNAEHGRFRRTYAPAFTEKAVRGQETLVLRHTETLVRQLNREASKGRPVNVVAWFEYVAFDIVGDLSYSHSFNCLKHDENRYQIDIVQNAMKAFTLAVVPRILGIDWVPQLPLPRTSLQKRKTYFRTLNHWTHQRLAEPDTDTRNDLMKYASLRKNKGLSLSETENSIGDMMIAGSETVASTLAAITYHLVRTPGACRVLTQEIRGCFKTEIEINMSGVSGLPYLNAVINEAMRLCPTLPMVLPRIVPESGARICGHWFPAGVRIVRSLIEDALNDTITDRGKLLPASCLYVPSKLLFS